MIDHSIWWSVPLLPLAQQVGDEEVPDLHNRDILLEEPLHLQM